MDFPPILSLTQIRFADGGNPLKTAVESGLFPARNSMSGENLDKVGYWTEIKLQIIED